MSNGSRNNFCYLSNDAICILKLVDRKIILPRVITLPHFPLQLRPVITSIVFLLFLSMQIVLLKNDKLTYFHNTYTYAILLKYNNADRHYLQTLLFKSKLVD